jgi:hypothetical protein
VRLRDLSVFVYDVGDAPRVLLIFRVGRAVRDADRPVGVAQQRKGKPELLGEGLVLGRRVEADAEDFDVLRLVLRQEVPEPGTLARSAGCVGLRVEPEDDFLSAQIGKADAVTVVIGDVEVGSILAGLEHGWFSSRDDLQDSA